MSEGSHNHLPTEPENLLGLKLRSLVVILIIGVVGGLIPLKRQSPRLQSLGNCFSGGVFLAAAFVHMLAESVEGFEELGVHDKSAFLYCMAGIFIPFFVEKLLFSRYSQTSVILEAGAKSSTGMKSTIHIYLLLLMLSIHSLIEGVALGVQSTSIGVSALFWAVGAHKFFDSFALGISLVKAEISTKAVVQMISLLSLMTPMGIVSGIVITTFAAGKDEKGPETTNVLSEAIKAIAAGTFIYVALIEVIMEEFGGHSHSHNKDIVDEELAENHSHNYHDGHAHDHGHAHEHPHVQEQQTQTLPSPNGKTNNVFLNWQKFGMLILGMVVMSLLSIFGEHGHGSSHNLASSGGHAHG